MAAKSFAVSDEISILIFYLLDVLGACSDDSFHRVHIPNEGLSLFGVGGSVRW